jgi:tetratricopeptide (TPR) repeat protein
MLRRLRRLPAVGWPDFRSSRGLSALGLSAVLVLLALIPVAIAQSSRRAQPDLDRAVRAFVEGRYEEVANLTSRLDQRDPTVVGLAGRALIARGRYADAEQALRPAAAADPSSDAALELGLLLQMLGRAEAAGVLSRVAGGVVRASDGAALARAGRALRALGRSQDANAAYRDAVSLSPDDPVIHTGWGELFLEKFNRAEALKSFQDALKADATWAPALLGAARALAEDNPPQAMAMATKALEINPSLVGARVFMAGELADAGKRDDARTSLQQALAVNPSSLEARSLLAGLAFVEDKQEEFLAEVGRVLAISPAHGEVYRVAGELAARNYRFPEAAVLVRRGLELSPGNPRILADLGVHLLRTGDEPGARTVLEASFKIDPFDQVTFNLLQMMDTLDQFVTAERGPIVLRMHPDEVPVMQEQALRLAEQALATFEKRYQVPIEGPILVEIFPKHDDFAVRNVGLPGMIGALGACFGKVVTMDSPRARPPGEFQWEATLWHELAHVVTLQMSRQRVPRWLTEGVSVYEEKLARPEWGRGMDVSFGGLLNRGETIKLRDLNAAFTDPRTISLAYYQASLLVEHLVATFGDAGLHRLLRAYGEGLEGDAALTQALNTTFDDLQVGFDRKIDAEFGAIREALKVPGEDAELLKLPVGVLRALADKNPGSYPVQLALGHAQRKAGDEDEAMQAFERAAALLPLATGDDSPNAQIADIALQRRDYPRAIRALEAILASDFDNVGAARRLVQAMREGGVTDTQKLRLVHERIVAIDPFDAVARSTVGRLALQRGDAETAIREFRVVLALKPVDQAAAHADLAESYLKSGLRAEARKQTLAALEIAPSYERAQDLLLELAGDRR